MSSMVLSSKVGMSIARLAMCICQRAFLRASESAFGAGFAFGAGGVVDDDASLAAVCSFGRLSIALALFADLSSSDSSDEIVK